MKKSITITNNNQSDMVKVTAFGIDIKKNHSVVLFFFSWSFKLSLKLFYLKFVIFYVSKCNRIRFLREIYIREKTIFLLLFFFSIAYITYIAYCYITLVGIIIL